MKKEKFDEMAMVALYVNQFLNDDQYKGDCHMIINCTKKLQEELGIKPEKLIITDRLYSWHAHIICVNRRKTVVLVNDASRYQVVLYGLKAKDFKNLNQLILDGIATILLSDGVNSKLVDAYLEQCGSVAYSKSQGAKYTAWINKGCEIAEWYGEDFDPDAMLQQGASMRANGYPGAFDGQAYAVPTETFYTALEQRFGYPRFCCQAVVLMAKLEIEGFDIWRKVVVPLYFTFEQLHEIMQILFDWKDYHLHEFVLLEGEKPLVCLVLDEEMVYDVAPMKAEIETGVLLSKYLPKCKRLVYTYDFGDTWEHTITVDKVLFDYDKNYAVCLDGAGVAPPEDVGGEGGFAEYIEVKNDPYHPAYDKMRQWAGTQWDAKFDMECLNRELCWRFKR